MSRLRATYIDQWDSDARPVISSALLTGNRVHKTLCYPGCDSSRDRRTPVPGGHASSRDLKIFKSLLDPKITAKQLFLKHQPQKWAMHLLH